MSHWYDRDGNCRYTVTAKNGKERPTTLADARKMNLLPSVTTIIGQVAKPQLENWKMNQLLDAAHRNRLMAEFEIFKARVWDDYKKETSVYSTVGVEVHDKLEKYFIDGTISDEDEGRLMPAILQINNLGFDMYDPEPSFASEEGYGGKIDLILSKFDRMAIVDFKTKQGSQLNEKSIYVDYIMQLAAYRNAINPTAECYNLLISVINPEVVYLHKHSEEDLQKGLNMFRSLMQYWKLVNNFECAFEV